MKLKVDIYLSGEDLVVVPEGRECPGEALAQHVMVIRMYKGSGFIDIGKCWSNECKYPPALYVTMVTELTTWTLENMRDGCFAGDDMRKSHKSLKLRWNGTDWRCTLPNM